MAVRHEVENLIRRGNIFYWRPRIPAHFTACPSGSRLSLSLQVSDHRKAQMVARRLNTRLAEMRFVERERMSTREQLQKLFIQVRDEMLDHLEDVSVAAKRNGRADDIEELEHDLEMGWAYKLLAQFGLRRELTLEDDCSGTTYLLKNGVPASHIPAIRANYRSELKRSIQPSFENSIRKLMQAFDIDDNPINREKAASRFFEGKAEALLDVDDRHPLADRTLSEFTGGGRPALTLVPNAAEEPKTKQAASSPEPVIAADDTSSPPNEVKPATDPQPVVALAAFESECNKLIANMGAEWEPATARDVLALVRLFKTVLEEHRVEHSGQITQYHIGKLRQHFNDIPARWGQSHRMRAMSAPELRAEGEKLRAAAAVTGEKAKVGLTAGTVRKHFGNLQHFLKHIRGHGFEITNWTFEGLRPRKPAKGSIRSQQFKPTPEDIAPIFSSPIYTGSLNSGRGRSKPGNQVYHDSLYFLPIMLTYLGARRREFAALEVDDIYREAGSYIINLKPNSLRRLKNEQSQRILPLPDELIRLGILDYQKAIRKLGYVQLFPDLFSDKTDNDPGDRFYDAFTPIMRKALQDKMWNRALHALRHGMANTLFQAGVPPTVIDDISGRLGDESETATRYTDMAGLPLMREALSKYPIITAGVERKPIQLLPWVENKQPAPWARRGKKDA
ncbi:integrase [Rhizobium sp. SG2393]|uniref:integrase n=1 Tax=Rhizobium sp. SG2393 TaxID=3276279 RepID=UPI003670F3D7